MPDMEMVSVLPRPAPVISISMHIALMAGECTFRGMEGVVPE